MRYLAAYRDTTDTTSKDRFKALTQLEDEIFSSGEFEVFWHKDSLSLGDNNGVVQLVDPYGTLRDQVSYGNSYNLVAENSFVPDSLLDSLDERNSLTSLRRASFSEAYADNSSGYVADQPDPHTEPFHVIGSTGFSREKACKFYELKNHLGNVLVTVSDLKLGQDTVGATDTANYYYASVLSAQDYYPFGWMMPERQVSAPQYRYGFNGKEKDDSWNGNGNSLDFGARVLDSRIGRWLIVDPLDREFPMFTPYNFAYSSPIVHFDPDGMAPEGGGDCPGPGCPELTSDLESPFFVGRLFTTFLVDTKNGAVNFFFRVKSYVLNEESRTEIYYDNDLFDSQYKEVEIGNFFEESAGTALDLATAAGPFSGGSGSATSLLAKTPIQNPGSLIRKTKQAAEVAEVANTVSKTARPIKLTSIVKRDSKLLKIAQQTLNGDEVLRRQINSVIDQISKGNLNPGMNTKHLFNGIYEARTKAGGRMYFRNMEEGVEIVAYSNKKNQKTVLDYLRNTYE